MAAPSVRVLTYNLLTIDSAHGAVRHRVARDRLRALRPDVVALQEVCRRADLDQAADLLGPEFDVVDLPGRVAGVGECLAVRWPVRQVALLDVPLPGGACATAAAVEIDAPVGPLLAVHHRGTFELDAEHVRERQAVATARFVEELVGGRRDLPVVLLGDLNAGPDASSIRFIEGRQSLDGMSVRYENAWTVTHGDEPGHTFTPANPLVRAGQMPLERGRRIDHVMVRSGPHGPLLDTAACDLVFDGPVGAVWASDHFGVLAELRPPPHPPGTWSEPTVE
ncbi:endonuclease/exonuclease/phosphatase family protein [Pseudonocardia sp. TRM90224]|uniref:endonuclease/exonuclease/phosphatase family protein n=1 Tax=Pseudonocardia sp. TRM90224 TaxID=2812678 RepID=UPI001E4F150C|nr:endonuclease/exonuclease/phosphatase family protein [Pseudonocardia sp. TRM90224]